MPPFGCKRACQSEAARGRRSQPSSAGALAPRQRPRGPLPPPLPLSRPPVLTPVLCPSHIPCAVDYCSGRVGGQAPWAASGESCWEALVTPLCPPPPPRSILRCPVTTCVSPNLLLPPPSPRSVQQCRPHGMCPVRARSRVHHLCRQRVSALVPLFFLLCFLVKMWGCPPTAMVLPGNRQGGPCPQVWRMPALEPPQGSLQARAQSFATNQPCPAGKSSCEC